MLFYLLYITGILIFAVVPAVEKDSLGRAALLGGLFGFFTYATYDLTNLATFEDWPLKMVVVDIAWGVVLCAGVATCSWLFGNARPMTGSSGQTIDRKVCATYGRIITWRRRWARNWAEVRYCCRACRNGIKREVDRRLEETILALLHQRPAGASICPSEAARAIAQDDGWRALTELARRTARRLAHQGPIEITQRGRLVDPCEFRGPIRLRLESDRRTVRG